MDASLNAQCGSPSAGSAARRITRKGLKILGLVAYTLLFAEVFIRLFSHQMLTPRYVTGTPWGVRGNIPNAHYWHHTKEVTVQYRINAQGMRADRDFSLQKPVGTCRVAVFGDSFFAGYELDVKDAFTTRLEEGLRATGLNVEVLNFSVSGFGQAEMLRAYEGQGRTFDPDVVVFEWHGSDPDDNVRSNLYALRGDRLVPNAATYLPGIELQDALMKSRLYRLVADNSHLYSFVREEVAQLVKDLLAASRKSFSVRAAASVPADAPTHKDSAAVSAEVESLQPRYEIRLSAALLTHAQDEIRSEQRDFYVVEIPRRISRTRFRSALELLPPETIAALTIVSPFEAFKQAARPDLKLYYESGPGHLTPVATELLARDAVRTISTAPTLQRCASPTTSQVMPPIRQEARRQ